MEQIDSEFGHIQAQLTTLRSGFKQAMDWYVGEMNTLKYQLKVKEQEIIELKNKLNEKSSK